MGNTIKRFHSVCVGESLDKIDRKKALIQRFFSPSLHTPGSDELAGTTLNPVVMPIQVTGLSLNNFFTAETINKYTYNTLSSFTITVSGGRTPFLRNLDPPGFLPFRIRVKADLTKQPLTWTKNRPPVASSPVYISTYSLDGTKRSPIFSSDPDGDTISGTINDSNSIGQSGQDSFASVPGLTYDSEAQEFVWSTKNLNESHKGLWFTSLTLGDAYSSGECCKSTAVVVIMAEVLGYQILGIGR